MKNQETGFQEEKQSPWFLRNLIAILITGLVVGVTIYIAVFLLYSPNKSGEINTSFIGQTLLPLWGTWIGTVLAYYFGKVNFEAATKSYRDVIDKLTPDEKIAKLLVKDVMIPINLIVYLDYDTENENPISDILKYPQFEKYSRFAVLDQKKAIKNMIHRNTFFEFVFLKVSEGKNNNEINKLKLKDLLNETNDSIKNTLTRGYGFVSINSTLLDAKKAIDSIAECQDVFITETGKPSEPVLGLVTNNMIFEKAKV